MKNKIGIIISAIALAVLVIGGVLYANWDQLSTRAPDPAPETSTSDTPTVAQQALTVDLGMGRLVALYDRYSWEWIQYSYSTFDQERTAKAGSNGVSLPFDLTITEEMKNAPENEGKTEAQLQGELIYDQLLNEILRSPLYGDMVARGLIDLTIDGKTLGELNPWLAEFVTKMDAAYTADSSAANCGNRGSEAWLTLRVGEGDKIFVTQEYREYAAGIATLMNRLYQKGIVKNLTSSVNFCLSPEVIDYARRTIVNGTQESQPAFVLQYEDIKTGVVYLRIGFNLIDKRFESFDKKASLPTTETPPQDQPPADTTPPSTKPSEKLPDGDPDPSPSLPGGNPDPSDPLPSGNPDPSDPLPSGNPDPPPSKKPDGEGGKDPAEDPVNQGNAPIGGGKNDDPGPGPYGPADSVQKPDGTTIVLKPDGSTTTADEMNDPKVGSEDPKNDDGHKVDKVDGSEDPPPVTTPITQDPDVGGSWGQNANGQETVNNGDGQGDRPADSTAAPDPVVTEAIEDPF